MEHGRSRRDSHRVLPATLLRRHTQVARSVVESSDGPPASVGAFMPPAGMERRLVRIVLLFGANGNRRHGPAPYWRTRERPDSNYSALHGKQNESPG
jgi:hypothetical protein